MASTLERIDREQLLTRIESGEQLVLVDALSPMSYAASHLPGAVSIPPEEVDERAAGLIPAREVAVVVYCAGRSCDSSRRVAERLVQLGYRNVAHYEAGKEDWVGAGLPLEGGRV